MTGAVGQAGEEVRRSLVVRWWRPVVVAVTALVARVLYRAYVLPTYFPLSDASHYGQIADNLASGRGFSLAFPTGELHTTAFRPPLYPMLLGAVYRVTGTDLDVGRAVNIVLGVVVAVLAFAVARRIAGPLAGLVAGGLVAVYPPLLANDTVLLTEPLSLALLLGMILALVDRRWLVAGVLLGLLVLARPSAQYLVVVVVAWLLWQLGWRRALACAGVAALVVAPWIVRNWAAMGSPVLVTSNGFNYAAIYSPPAQAQGGFVDPTEDPFFDSYGLEQLDEVAWQETLQRIALDNLRENPRLLPAVIRRNALAYFELTPERNEVAEYYDGRNEDFRATTLPLFFLVTLAGLGGLALRWRQPAVVLILGIMGYFVASSLVLIPAPRLRAPFDVLCCVGVGLLVAWAADRRRGPTADPPTAAPPVTSSSVPDPA